MDRVATTGATLRDPTTRDFEAARLAHAQARDDLTRHFDEELSDVATGRPLSKAEAPVRAMKDDWAARLPEWDEDGFDQVRFNQAADRAIERRLTRIRSDEDVRHVLYDYDDILGRQDLPQDQGAKMRAYQEAIARSAIRNFKNDVAAGRGDSGTTIDAFNRHASRIVDRLAALKEHDPDLFNDIETLKVGYDQLGGARQSEIISELGHAIRQRNP